MKGHGKKRKPILKNRACFSFLKLQINEIAIWRNVFALGTQEYHLSVQRTPPEHCANQLKVAR